MPSAPKRLSPRDRVRVTHPLFGEKDVERRRLSSLGPDWTRVQPGRKKKSARAARPTRRAPAPARAANTGNATPEASKED